MADYYTPTVIQQTIPEADMTPLERLLLSHILRPSRTEKAGISSPSLIRPTRP